MLLYVLCLICFNVQIVICDYHQAIDNIKSNNCINEGTNIRNKNNCFTDNFGDKVMIEVYYECLCPYSSQFNIVSLTPVIQKLGQYVNITTYPYGKAKTITHNGNITFKCQHGPQECYGNKLHACALALLKNKTLALLFNNCMMNPKNHSLGSDDNAAETCGKAHNVNASLIKECAKGEKGVQLLKYYGDESRKINFNYVPYILINKKLYQKKGNFMKTVCKAFTNTPRPCH